MSFYGIDQILRRHCRDQQNDIPTSLSWQHGWSSQARQRIDPVLLIQEPEIDPAKTYLVARKDEVDYLRQNGIKSKAVGLPFVYAQPMPCRRIPNSLLVMPAHSLEYTAHNWKFEEYADQIAQIADQFDRVAVCIHASCARKGYWQPHFQRHNMDCIVGADAFDANGLVRIKTLMRQFEFMTTNTLGSHIAYGSASAMRVSIFGEYAELKAADFSNTEFYNLHPHVLGPIIDLHSQRYVRSNYGQFFCDPRDAQLNQEWADAEIGTQNRLPPHEMRKLLGWDLISVTKKNLKLATRSVFRGPEKFVKRFANSKRFQ